jgi:hypothetical protein
MVRDLESDVRLSFPKFLLGVIYQVKDFSGIYAFVVAERKMKC